MIAALRALAALVYPARASCMGCGSVAGCDEDWLCPACRAELDAQHVPAEHTRDLLSVNCAYWYGGVAGQLVRTMKYRGGRCLAPLLAEGMADRLDSYCRNVDAIAAVPMYWKRRFFRGYNQAELLADALSDLTGIPSRPLLRRVRNTKQQARLSWDRRLHNLDGAFRADGAAKGLRILLVDDVYTSGMTARGCAQALLAAGASHVRLCAACRASE